MADLIGEISAFQTLEGEASAGGGSSWGSVEGVSGEIGISNFPYKLTNPSSHLTIPTYDGSGQAMHPKMLYFKNGWNGYKFWMAFTPYPNSNDYYENPSIVVSNDGETWIVPSGLINPLDSTTNKTVYYNSDPHLVYREDLNRIECWYRTAYINLNKEIIYRRCSTDGINWTEREELFNTLTATDVLENTLYNCLSPVVNYYNGKYRIWGATGPQGNRYFSYWESENGDNWEKIRNIEINCDTHYISHQDFVYHEGKFICVFSAINKTSGALEHLMYAISYDNITYSSPVVILDRGTSGSWDDSRMYRPSWIVVDDELWLCYCATRSDGTWGTGIIKIPNTVSMSAKNYIDRLLANLVYKNLALNINVTPPVQATGITLDKTTLSFSDSSTQTIVATLEPSNADASTLTWSSSNDSIATVSNGVVTPISNGSCTITAAIGSVSATCNVTVAIEQINLDSDILYKLSESTVFGGTNYIDTSINLLSEDKDFSIAFKAQGDGNNGKADRLFQCEENGNGIFMSWDASWRIRWAGTTGAYILDSSNNSNIEMVITHQKGSTDLNVYLNPERGIKFTDDSYNTTLTGSSTDKIVSTRSFVIGARNEYDYIYNGTISDFRIYNAVISDTKISAYFGS